MIAQTFRTLEATQEGRVLTVRIDHPPRNLYDEHICADLEVLVRQVEGDPSIGAVVFTGKPDDTFITRYDTREILRDTTLAARLHLPESQARAMLYLLRALRRIPGLERLLLKTPLRGAVTLHRHNAIFRTMNRMDKAFVAAINGMAVGGGFLLPLACDLRLIADDAGPVGLPEPALGIIPALGGTTRATRLLGPGRTIELLLEGHHLTPAEAEEWGLVNQVIPRAELLNAAQLRARRLADFPPGMVARVKRLAYDGGQGSLARANVLEGAAALTGLATPRARATVGAFTARLHGPEEVDADQIEAYRLAVDGQLVDEARAEPAGRQ